MGQNIGTCVTALISSIGVNRSARRVAVVHISFNLIGTAVLMALFYGGDALFHFPFMDGTISAVGVAMCHTIFNVLTTVLLLPFAKQLEKLARTLVPAGSQENVVLLDPLLMRTPAVAISECVNVANQMGDLGHHNILLAIAQLTDYQEDRGAEIEENEDKLDTYEDRLGKFLVEVSRQGMTGADSRTVSRLLHAIGDFERIGDHALNIQESARELHDKELEFSDSAKGELTVLCAALTDIMEIAFRCFSEDDAKAALNVEPLEETIDRLIEAIRLRHIDRLQTGRCTIQLGFVLNDLLTNIERVSDHCSNIAMCVIEEKYKEVARHTYLSEIKMDGSFHEGLKKDLSKYILPKE